MEAHGKRVAAYFSDLSKAAAVISLPWLRRCTPQIQLNDWHTGGAAVLRLPPKMNALMGNAIWGRPNWGQWQDSICARRGEPGLAWAARLSLTGRGRPWSVNPSGISLVMPPHQTSASGDRHIGKIVLALMLSIAHSGWYRSWCPGARQISCFGIDRHIVSRPWPLCIQAMSSPTVVLSSRPCPGRDHHTELVFRGRWGMLRR